MAAWFLLIAVLAFIGGIVFDRLILIKKFKD